MKIVRMVLMGFSLLYFSGCAFYYQPSVLKPFEKIREFSSDNYVTLINGQPSTERVFFASGRYINISKPYANLQTWTDTTISIAERELTKRGLHVLQEAPKSLTMSIESAKTDVGWVVVTSQIAMLVKTSDGYSATYIGKDMSSYYLHLMYYPAFGNAFLQGVNTALMRVVVAMLNDPQIVAFLSK